MTESSQRDIPAQQAKPPALAAPPRLWPAVLAVALVFTSLFLPTALFPESPKGFMPLITGLFVGYGMLALWWLLASRTPLKDRLIGFAVFAGCLLTGMAGGFHASLSGVDDLFTILFYVAPWLMAAIVATLVVTKPLGWNRSRWVALVATLASFAAIALVRYDGADSAFTPKFSARWRLNDEERLLASLEGASDKSIDESALAEAGPDDWPGFRGAGRDGRLADLSLAGDWNATPPKEIWRRPVGPGWSSFCIVGGLAYTQEQRGEEECVMAYDAATGDQVWQTAVEDRFYNSAGGAGPRATPTFHAGALYATGATGAVQKLDPATGEVLWRKFLLGDPDRGREGVTKLESAPIWGFASSPLVIDDGAGRTLAIVYANAPKHDPGTPPVAEAVVAFDAQTGEVAWRGGVGWHGYSSPHLATLGGVRQILMESNLGLESLDPATGERLWFFEWDIMDMNRSIQPLVVDDSTVVLSAGYDSGTMVIDVVLEGGKWTAKERWPQPSHELEPYFNDMVLYDGHLYGISKKFLVSIDLETGKSTWPRKVKRKSQIGNGQLVLDEASGLLLATNETSGEVLLVEANPETLVVRGVFQALEPGVNWNHPVVTGGRLYVRDGVEAACFELPAAADTVAFE